MFKIVTFFFGSIDFMSMLRLLPKLNVVYIVVLFALTGSSVCIKSFFIIIILLQKGGTVTLMKFPACFHAVAVSRNYYLPN